MVHQYKNNGYNIVLDVCSGSVHVVDDLVYDIISLYEEKDKEQMIKALPQYDSADVAEAYDEVAQLVEDGTLFTDDVYKDYMEFSNGNHEVWDYIHHKGAAAVIPVMDDGRLLMVRQYRNALDRFTLELPAGGLDQADEPGRDCSARELEEETGYHSDDLEWLITLRTTVALCNEKIEVYVARNLIRTHQHLDENEFVNVEAHTVEELKQMIFEGKIEDSKTVAAILAYDAKYNR